MLYVIKLERKIMQEKQQKEQKEEIKKNFTIPETKVKNQIYLFRIFL